MLLLFVGAHCERHRPILSRPILSRPIPSPALKAQQQVSIGDDDARMMAVINVSN